MRQYGLLAPDRYVSQAASDVQGAWQNAAAQSARADARRGVSAGSGAAAALGRQREATLATALAAAKTKARQVGIDEKTKMLSTMTDAAKTLYGMGSDSAQQALSAQGAGAGAKKDAAGVLGSAAGVLGEAGGLEAKAGALFESAAGIFGSASNLGLNYANLLQGAYRDLANAQLNAANYYARAAATEVSAVNGGGGGGVNVIDNTREAIAARAAAHPGTSGRLQIFNGKLTLV